MLNALSLNLFEQISRYDEVTMAKEAKKDQRFQELNHLNWRGNRQPVNIQDADDAGHAADIGQVNTDN